MRKLHVDTHTWVRAHLVWGGTSNQTQLSLDPSWLSSCTQITCSDRSLWLWSGLLIRRDRKRQTAHIHCDCLPPFSLIIFHINTCVQAWPLTLHCCFIHETLDCIHPHSTHNRRHKERLTHTHTHTLLHSVTLKVHRQAVRQWYKHHGDRKKRGCVSQACGERKACNDERSVEAFTFFLFFKVFLFLPKQTHLCFTL